MSQKLIQTVENQVTKSLMAKINRAGLGKAFAARVLYPMYQNAQRTRWISENASEGSQWPALSPTYKEYKLKRYGGGPKYKWVGGRGRNRPWEPDGNWPSFPGGGTKMMIATGTLVNSVTGDDRTYHRALFTENSMQIFTTVEYSTDANSKRNFTKFSDKTLNQMRQSYLDYVWKGNQA